jgi:hypothetical protein
MCDASTRRHYNGGNSYVLVGHRARSLLTLPAICRGSDALVDIGNRAAVSGKKFQRVGRLRLAEDTMRCSL